MNVIWIVADTFRRDHVGAYGNPTIRTPSLDALAARSVRSTATMLPASRPCHASRPSYGALDDVLHGLGAPACGGANHCGGAGG